MPYNSMTRYNPGTLSRVGMYGRVAYGAGKALGSFIRNRMSNRNRSRGNRSGSMAEAGTVTNQYDVRTQYRSRRRKRGSARRFRRFLRLAERINQQGLGLKIQTFLGNEANTSLAGQQQAAGWLTYGPNGAAGGSQFNNDLATIFTTEFTAPTTASQLHFKSCVMDIEVVNTGTPTIVVDAYYVVCRKSYTNVNFTNVAQSFASAVTEVAAIGAGTQLIYTQPGISPFDAPNFCQYFKIYRKQRLVLSSGQTSSFIIKDHKKKKIESEDAYGYSILRGQKGILVIWSGVVDAAGTIPATTVSFSVNKNYHYFQNVSGNEEGAQH